MGGAGDTEGCGRGIRRVNWWIWRVVRGYERLGGLRRYGHSGRGSTYKSGVLEARYYFWRECGGYLG